MPGEIVHIEIPADDTTRSQEFWGSLFGWQFQANPGPFEYHTTQIGGEANEAMPVPGMGWFSACKDPHGNEFGLWQIDTSAPAPGQ